MITKEFLDRRKAFGDPRSSVKQRSRFAKRGEIDLDLFASNLLQLRDRSPIQCLSFIITEELKLIRRGNAEAEIGIEPRCRILSRTRYA